jgi:hypothetical protein
MPNRPDIDVRLVPLKYLLCHDDSVLLLTRATRRHARGGDLQEDYAAKNYLVSRGADEVDKDFLTADSG